MDFANATYGPFTELGQDVFGRLSSPSGVPRDIKRQALDYARAQHGPVQSGAARIAAFVPEYAAASRLFSILGAAGPAGAGPGPTLARPLLQGAQFGSFEAGAGIVQGDSPEELASRTGQGFVGGMGFGAAGEVGSRAVGAISRSLEGGRRLHGEAQAALRNTPTPLDPAAVMARARVGQMP
ncbi:MAG: hypothetical protein NTV85_28515, partial [Hyphomicrobiales bacterium]|nr:hypothetical protein [Hyphomicrobiales bacterium]